MLDNLTVQERSAVTNQDHGSPLFVVGVRKILFYSALAQYRKGLLEHEKAKFDTNHFSYERAKQMRALGPERQPDFFERLEQKAVALADSAIMGVDDVLGSPLQKGSRWMEGKATEVATSLKRSLGW